MKNDNLNNKSGFSTPKGYFEEFDDRLFSKINLDNNLTKKTGYSTPDNYFDKIEDRLLNQIKTEKPDSGFSIPKDYFNKIEDKVLNNINSLEKETTVIPLYKRIPFQRIASIAAIFIIGLIGLKFFSNSRNEQLTFDSVDFASIEEYINTEDLSINEYELADLYDLNEEDLDLISNNNLDENQLYEYLSDEITPEDYIDNL